MNLSLDTSGIVFKDVPNGGYYCNVCNVSVHPDMVPSHKHRAYGVGTKSGEQATPAQASQVTPLPNTKGKK